MTTDLDIQILAPEDLALLAGGAGSDPGAPFLDPSFAGPAPMIGPCPNPDAFPIGPCPNPDANGALH